MALPATTALVTELQTVPERSRRTVFANPDVLPQGWYIAAPAHKVVVGKMTTCELGARRILLYRDPQGKPVALDTRCSHLGADLSQGCLVNGEVQCPFHHWRFGPDGHCTSVPRGDVPRRHVRAYPVLERWGLVWIFNGPEVLFDLPECDPADGFVATPTPLFYIAAHPHLAIMNGLDELHFETMHGLRLLGTPRIIVEPPYRVSFIAEATPNTLWTRLLSGNARRLRFTYTTIGAQMAWVELEEPMRFRVLFTVKPDAHGHTVGRSIVFAPRGFATLRALLTLILITTDDKAILNRIDFQPGFTDADEALRAFAATVNRLPTW